MIAPAFVINPLEGLGYRAIPEEVWVMGLGPDPRRMMTAIDADGDHFVVVCRDVEGLEAFAARWRDMEPEAWPERITIQEVVGRLKISRGYLMVNQLGEEIDRRYVRGEGGYADLGEKPGA